MDACRYDGLLVGFRVGRSDANNDLNDLRNPLLQLGFEARTEGSRDLFRKSRILERITIYGEGLPAKTY